ncbi:Mu-like prophage DNA circulation protein [Edwardsiella tarda]|nr:Mu-like prophage DNA circulation protein [Edwardsiella tarda]
MSWQDSLQDASFKGVRFDVLRESTSHGRDHADHEYPFIMGLMCMTWGVRRAISASLPFFGERIMIPGYKTSWLYWIRRARVS